ncbi:MAG TPA: GYD domain-containing protein [Devosia sp.]|jgi:uncharacterized protein with GYD domain|nr:GYD domain-containing protein [Devosia sp.]
MPTYFIFETSTGAGLSTVRDAPRRSSGVVASGKKMGVDIKQWFYVTGPFDFIMQAEAPDDETVAAFVMAINSGGNVTAKFHRAYTPEAWAAMVTRLG